MAHSILRFIFWAGILVLVYGLFVASLLGSNAGSSYLTFGFIIIIIAIVVAALPDVLRTDQVIDVWATLIEKANGKADEVLATTWAFLKESKAPALNIVKKKISTSVLTGLVGNEREFLVLTDKQRLSLRQYQIFINSKDYGENLDVSWYLTRRPTVGQAIASLIMRSASTTKDISDLNVFDQQDLRACVTNAHNCLRKAVEKIMFDTGQDPSKVDWKSKGFLGIS
ncbi:MAG TPA: hypothetical protein VLX91_10965 [Candidatus Acidoferrales bacterium]|nr:hypothetical protein [Candidatus Acidoferrales bacterium]